MATDNPLLQWWAKTAFENGYGQDEFAEGIDMYARQLMLMFLTLMQSLKARDNTNARTEAASCLPISSFQMKCLVL